MSPLLAQNGPSKFCREGLMLRAERTWRGRYLRVTRVTPLTFYPEWMVQVAHQGSGAPQVHGGLGRAFARNYVRRNSLEYSGLRGEGSTPVPLPPPAWPKPHILRVSLWAIKPNSGSDFSFELRTPSWQGTLIILRKV